MAGTPLAISHDAGHTFAKLTQPLARRADRLDSSGCARPRAEFSQLNLDMKYEELQQRREDLQATINMLLETIDDSRRLIKRAEQQLAQADELLQRGMDFDGEDDVSAPKDRTKK
jgi:hypothetical protein